jgi:hypothetical protein
MVANVMPVPRCEFRTAWKRLWIELYFICYARFDILVFSWHCTSSWFLDTALCMLTLTPGCAVSVRNLVSTRHIVNWLALGGGLLYIPESVSVSMLSVWESLELTHVLAVRLKYYVSSVRSQELLASYYYSCKYIDFNLMSIHLSRRIRLRSYRSNRMGVFSIFLVCGRYDIHSRISL